MLLLLLSPPLVAGSRCLSTTSTRATPSASALALLPPDAEDEATMRFATRKSSSS